MAITVITNVKIFNGIELTETGSVVIEDGFIVNKTAGDTVVDGSGCTILPGLIDSHVHLYNIENLEESAKFGVTTMLDMGTRSPNIVDGLKNHAGLPDIRSSYSPAFAPGSKMPKKMKFPSSSIVTNPADATRFVKEQIFNGADYIKIILEDQGKMGGVAFPAEILDTIIETAHQNEKRVIAHVVSPNSFRIAANAGVDVLTHIPFMASLSSTTIETMAMKGLIAVPTMVTMNGIIRKIKRFLPFLSFNYKFVEQSVTAMQKAGITLLAGSDANTGDSTTPFSAPYGAALQDELGLLVGAGLTPIKALQSATSAPAKYWGFNDRGIIESGRRADLLLVEGNPTEQINDVKNIRQVWIAGIPINK